MAGRIERSRSRTRLPLSTRRRIIKEWPGQFKNHPAFILCCGPSLNSLEEYSEDLEDYYFTIGANRCFNMIIPNILFFQDASVYSGSKEDKEVIDEIAKDSLILCRRNICRSQPRMEYRQIVGRWGFYKNLLRLHGARTATPLLFQIAVNLGFSSIIFCGVDCGTHDSKGQNFFGPTKHHKDNFVKQSTEGMKWCIEQAKRINKKIYCCSDNGLMDYTPISDVMIELEGQEKEREYYMDKLSID